MNVRFCYSKTKNQKQNLSKKEKHEPKLLAAQALPLVGSEHRMSGRGRKHLLKLTQEGYNSLMSWL